MACSRFALKLALPAFVLLAAFAAPAQADFFSGGYYSPIAGHVGQRLISDAAFSVGDVPPGCLVEWKNIAVSGTLPPGLAPPGFDATLVAPDLDANGIPQLKGEVPDVPTSAFAGTLRRAGDYSVTVTFQGLGCTGGQNYGDRAIKVNFHVEP